MLSFVAAEKIMLSNIEALSLRLRQVEDFFVKFRIVIDLLGVCFRSQKAGGDLDKHKMAVNLFAEKLKSFCTEEEAQFDTALKAKGNEIERLVATLAEIERDNEERAAELRQAGDDLLSYLSDIVSQKMRENEQLQREMDEIRIEQDRLEQQRLVEQRRRSGVSNAA